MRDRDFLLVASISKKYRIPLDYFEEVFRLDPAVKKAIDKILYSEEDS